MTQEERRARLEERRKNRKPSVSYVISNITTPCAAEDFEDYCGFWFYYQTATTIGLQRDFNHPNLECFITFTCDYGGHSVLQQLGARVKKGERFAAGDRTTVVDTFKLPWEVEFRESQNPYGPCLRAVVLGIGEEFQSLSYQEADEWLNSHGPLIDPYQ